MEERRRRSEDGFAATVGKEHGRLEVRRLKSTVRLNGYLSDWPGVRQVGLIERTRTVAGKTSTETVAFITSLPPERAGANRLLEIARAHWGVENRLHHVRDVAFREDACRSRAGAQVCAAIRNALLLLLRRSGFGRITRALRRFAANAAEALDLLRKPLVI